MEGRISISPSVQIQSVPTGPATQNRSVPIEIAQLSSGSTLRGFVINRDATNNPIIRTDKGDISVRSEIFLKTGSEVALRVEKNIAGVNARLISVDGEAIKDVIERIGNQPAKSGDSVSRSAIQNSSGTQTASTQSAAQGTLQNAIILQTQTASLLKTLPPALQNLTQKLVEGANLQVRLIGLETPLPTTDPKAPNVQTVAQQQNIQSASFTSNAYSKYGTLTTQTPSQNAAPTNASPQPGGVTFQVQTIGAAPLRLATPTLPAPLAGIFAKAEIAALTNVLQAQQTTGTVTTTTVQGSAPLTTLPPTAPLTVSADGRQVTAQVVGTERGGATILQTPIGTLRIAIPNPIPAGSVVRLDLSAALNAPQLTQTAPTIDAATQAQLGKAPTDWLGISRDWNALNSIMAILQDADPALSQQVTQRSFAQSGAGLTKGILFFLTALRAGTPKDWLGQNLLNHRDARIQELVKRVLSEFSAMRPLAAEQPDQPWQSAFIPVMHDREPEQLRVFWRDYGNAKQDGSREGDRFIIEATLSEIGELQFDGLVNTKTTPTSFDLAIRTPAPLDDTIKKDIQGLFYAAAEAAGFEGGLRFYEKPEHMEHPLEEVVKSLQQKANAEGLDSRSILA